MTDLARIVRFLGFTRCSPCAVEIRGINEDRHVCRSVACASLINAERILRAWDAEGLNLFFGVAPRHPGATGGRDALKACVACHIDIDEVGSVVSVPSPSLIVRSGGGRHVYFRLSEPVADWDRVEVVNQKLAVMAGGDKCWDASRILRVPGSTNRPCARKRAAGRVAAPVYVELEHDISFSIEELERLVAHVRVERRGRAEIEPGFMARLDEPLADDVLRKLLPRSLLSRKVTDRSAEDWDLAVDAFARGGTDEEVARLLWQAPWGKAREAGFAYLRRTLERAKARAADAEKELELT